VGGKIEDCFVLNGEKSGRPRVIGPLKARVILDVLTKDFSSRCSTAAELADAMAKELKDVPGANFPSWRSILRWLKKEGFCNVKITYKPGLNKA